MKPMFYNFSAAWKEGCGIRYHFRPGYKLLYLVIDRTCARIVVDIKLGVLGPLLVYEPRQSKTSVRSTHSLRVDLVVVVWGGREK